MTLAAAGEVLSGMRLGQPDHREISRFGELYLALHHRPWLHVDAIKGGCRRHPKRCAGW